jgi:VCBS repeat-containing protein
MGLKQQLKAGESVPLTLTVEGKGGQKETVQIAAPVKALGQ